MTSRTSDDRKMFGQIYRENRLIDGAAPNEIGEGIGLASLA